MTKIATPPDLAGMFAACEDAYEQATREGFFRVEFATMRVDQSYRTTREACITLHAAIGQAWTESRLHNRCLMVLGRQA
jgi:hypothetical protein